MSCTYDVYCKTCSTRLGFEGANNQADEMAAIVALSPFLRILAGQIREFNVVATVVPRNTVEVLVTGTLSDQPLRLEWFLEHEGHELTVIDEYGKLINECGAYYHCALCYHRKKCRRDKQHEGAHNDKRDA